MIQKSKHFLDDGETIDKISFDHFIGHCKVLEIPNDIDVIQLKHLTKYEINKNDRILFKTRNSSFVEDKEFHKDFVYLADETAEFLAGKGVLAVGIDYFSVEGLGDEKHVVHKSLLGKNVLIIEGLCLKGVPEGEYEMIAMPLKLKNGNGAPGRVILREL